MLPLEEIGGPGPASSSGAEDADDRPIGFALTSRARREVAPETLPALAVLPGEGGDGPSGERRDADGALEDPDDTRPARARALRRAGVPLQRIASQLGARTFLVAAWVGESAPEDADPARDQTTDGERAADAEEAQAEVASALARAAAAERGRQRLREDPGFAAGIALVAGVAAVDRHAVTVTTRSERVARQALWWMLSEVPRAGSTARVILRVGPSVAGDVARRRAAAVLGIDQALIGWTRWRGAPDPAALEWRVRLGDPGAAAVIGGGIDALFEPEEPALDLAE